MEITLQNIPEFLKDPEQVTSGECKELKALALKAKGEAQAALSAFYNPNRGTDGYRDRLMMGESVDTLDAEKKRLEADMERYRLQYRKLHELEGEAKVREAQARKSDSIKALKRECDKLAKAVEAYKQAIESFNVKYDDLTATLDLAGGRPDAGNTDLVEKVRKTTAGAAVDPKGRAFAAAQKHMGLEKQLHTVDPAFVQTWDTRGVA